MDAGGERGVACVDARPGPHKVIIPQGASEEADVHARSGRGWYAPHILLHAPGLSPKLTLFTDLRRILAQDSSNALAIAEMKSVLIIKRMVPGEDRTEDHDLIEDVLDLEEESDSEDYKHKGSGTPCRFHNRRGCTQGARCRFSHAPDPKSVRDELCVVPLYTILA